MLGPDPIAPEALEKKGIHYAHRKVIVDLAPELAEKMDVGTSSTARAGEHPSEKLTLEQKKEVITAGAAAALNTIAEQEKAGPEGEKKWGLTELDDAGVTVRLASPSFFRRPVNTD